MHRLKRIRIHPSAENSRGRTIVYLLCIGFLALYAGTSTIASGLQGRYEALQTDLWKDRTGSIVALSRNEKGHFAAPAGDVPELFESLLLKKEDRFFYYHLGVNPWSMLRGAASAMGTGRVGGSSTLTQQLVKILLGHESDRTIRNKLVESLYAVALELHASKREILTMYENTAYFGKSRQGIAEAASYFFNKEPRELSEAEMIQLIAALGNPSTRFPGSSRSAALLPAVAAAVGSDLEFASSTAPTQGTAFRTVAFELTSLSSCEACELTIDAQLTEQIRATLRRHIEGASDANVKNGAVVVIKLPENELLSIVGSPNPSSSNDGAQLNMALQPRPIGSTAKPFIYLTAFKKGARPFTLIEDEEYSYPLGNGFTFYPKNFDGKFRGTVTMHTALSNSLNVPAVKTLEYVTLSDFYSFLENDLGFKGRQPLDRYELGIALGALEMDLLTLSHFFTIFPLQGILKPLTIEKDHPQGLATAMEQRFPAKRVADEAFVQLVNKILSDRESGVEQFGLRSNLTLPYKNYALKTGTSRDYHDSWTVGYTPDFLVGVWLGNSDNKPMRELTGQTGAGAVWQDVMTLLYTSSYSKNTPLPFDKLKEFTDSGSIEYGLPHDTYSAARDLLKKDSLILYPHDGDIIELTKSTVVPLKARESVEWFIGSKLLGRGKEFSFSPKSEGATAIEARGPVRKETINIYITKEL